MDLSLRSPASPASPASPDVASPAPGAKFIWHSDAHVDPFYLTDRCCVERDLELLDLSAQPLGFMGCNPPISLVSQAFRASAAHDASFVLYTGDFARHEINKVVSMPDSLTVVTDIIKNISLLARQVFNEVSPVFGTLGNSDAGLDYFMPITSNESVNPWFSQIGGSIEHAGLMTQGELQEFKHGGFFQAREGNLSILSLDTVIYAMDHLPIRPLEADPFGQFAWLRQRLREAATAGQKVWIVGHVPPGIETFGYTELWHPQYVERYLDIVQDEVLGAVIAAQLFGHVHKDEIRLLPKPPKGAGPIFLSGALSPIHYNNPSFKIVEYDQASGRLRNLKTFIAEVGGNFSLKYDMVTAYGLQSLSMESMMNLSQRLLEGTDAWKTYAKWYASGYPNELQNFTAGSSGNSSLKMLQRQQYLCAMVIRSSKNFEACAGLSAQLLPPGPVGAPRKEKERLLLGRLVRWAQRAGTPKAAAVLRLAQEEQWRDLLQLFGHYIHKSWSKGKPLDLDSDEARGRREEGISGQPRAWMLFGTYVIAGELDAKATCESGLDLDASGDDSDSLEDDVFQDAIGLEDPMDDDDDDEDTGLSLREVVAGFLNINHIHVNSGTFQEDTREIRHLLPYVDMVCAPKVSSTQKKRYLEELSYALRPQELQPQAREMFVRQALARGVVGEAVRLIENASSAVAAAATNFLGDFAFNSDMGSREVLKVFDRIADRFQHLFSSSSDRVTLMISEDWLLQAAILLCVNIAATCPAGHMKLVRLVQPVCLKILQSPQVGDKLRGNTILLLANLSMTVLSELRELQVADALLRLVSDHRISDQGKSVAESVIIFLHGEAKCRQVDLLMGRDVVGQYCIPIMAHTLKSTEFRGMFPHLLYSAKLFQVLSRCRVYAEELLRDGRAMPLLLRAVNPRAPPPRVETDYEGRRLVLEALWSFARFRLWPAEEDADDSQKFIEKGLPLVMEDRHVGIRSAAVGIYAQLHWVRVLEMLAVGKRLEAEGFLPPGFWRHRIASQLFPFLT
ncbi:unnamed protein product [Effrenium voratum]|uniref:Calcineurin-like phosphoesterase domain-containing protein n=1 Tax=Effrenium voratum TaxID=2562239 RepID=A0AA36NFV1_9DINO|nr:unnamed protein product [Effrenium voratum]